MSKGKGKYSLKRGALIFWQNFSIPYFIRDVLVVICGIVFTFSTAGLFERHKIRSQIKVSVDLVKSELEVNVKLIDEFQESVKCNIEAFEYFRKAGDGVDSLSRDALDNYLNLAVNSPLIQLTRYALDVLNNSAHSEELDNVILLKLMSIYDGCHILQKDMDIYNNETLAMMNYMIMNSPSRGQNGQSNSEIIAKYSKNEVFAKRLNYPYFTKSIIIISDEVKEKLKGEIHLLDSLLVVGKFDKVNITRKQ